MNIGMIGLGKLGLPVALAIESKGHEVYGNDIDAKTATLALKGMKLPYEEKGADKLLRSSRICLGTLVRLAGKCDIIFIAVQTPHEKEYEGITRLPETRKDFDYTYLKKAYFDVVEAIKTADTDPLVVIISTCLPGTLESFIDPEIRTVYNPLFIAMGTTIEDFLNPEFVLIGWDGEREIEELKTLYHSLHSVDIFFCDIREAEMIKVSYNTFITSKIAIANTIMEMCHKLDINCDTVMDALYLGADRLISTKYLRGGMGDGGACHPRDNIALSWLARNLNLSYDWYEGLMLQREKQTDWLADLICEHHFKYPELPVYVIGLEFKPETDIKTGSPARLLVNLLEERGIEVNDGSEHKGIFFIACAHERYHTVEFESGSIVIDPHGIIEPQQGVKLISIGRKKIS